MEHNYLYDKDSGVSTYIIEYEGQYFTGIAHCAPEDADMQNEKTGINIAERRAIIKLFQYRRNELKHKLAALNQLYYSVNKSKKYDSHGYMENMLEHQRQQIQDELNLIKDTLKNEQQNLQQYLKNKDEFYKRIRANRNKDNIN